MLTAFFNLLSKSGLRMKKIIAGIVLSAAFLGCQDSESPTEITGNEVVYALEAGPDFEDISGTATFIEKKDGSAIIAIELEGTEGNTQHPVHLHLGDISEPDAEIAAMLAPVIGSTGKSQSLLTMLADETPITYAELIALNACIKIHLAVSGPDKDKVIALGNIGSAVSARTSGKIGICKSE